jgi:hypothetical protein
MLRARVGFTGEWPMNARDDLPRTHARTHRLYSQVTAHLQQDLPPDARRALTRLTLDCFFAHKVDVPWGTEPDRTQLGMIILTTN